MAVPGAVPEDAGFGIPLASHDEVALVAVAGDGERELVVKGDVKGDGGKIDDRAGPIGLDGDLGPERHPDLERLAVATVAQGSLPVARAPRLEVRTAAERRPR